MPTDKGNGIKDRLLSERQYLVISIFRSKGSVPTEGEKTISIKTGEAYVFQVLSVLRELKNEPYKIHNSSGTEVSAISPQSGITYQRLYDADGNDILRNTDEPWILHHFSLAVQQPEIRIYPKIPVAALMGGWTFLVAGEPDPIKGHNYGYVAGKNMEDYYNPPASLETFAWKLGTKSHISYGFFNESSQKRLIPLLNIQGRTYLVYPVTKEESKRKIVAGPPEGPPRTLTSIGPVIRPFDLEVPSEWREAGCMLEVNKATLPREVARGE